MVAVADLYIARDGDDQLCVWQHDPEFPGSPYCVARQSRTDKRIWAHLVATLPTRDEPQPEPLDPGVRVRDRHGDLWARFSDEFWASPGVPPRSWANLRGDFGPLTVSTPAPEPTPDERPFKVGERVRVADASHLTVCGRAGLVLRVLPNGAELAVDREHNTWLIPFDNLQHADADAPC